MIQQDKIEHWAFGFVLTLFAIIDPVFVWCGFIFAFGKETLDYIKRRRWDWLDINATLLGILVGIVFLWVYWN